MAVKVAKFGGTSLADAVQFRKVEAIVKGDPERRYVVPSAPGKRHKDDQKITDLLYLAHAAAEQKVGFKDTFSLIHQRYVEIAEALGLKVDLNGEMEKIEEEIRGGASADYAASRGEYLNGLLVAELLGFDFVDAAEVIRFDERGRFDSEKTQELVNARLKGHQHAVVPGFYGAKPNGDIKTFSRGGSDVSGAIVARGVGAAIYENWTDVSGLLMADPRVVENPRHIDMVTYRELRELSYMGASVLHNEAVFPVRMAGIPVQIRNTNRPGDVGTMIVPETTPLSHKGGITGIAGRKGFTIIGVDKAMMNEEIGFGRRLLTVLEANGISFEHLPSSIDTMSVIIADDQLNGKLEKVLEEIKQECRVDNIEAYPNMALVATVGRGMASTPGMASKLFGALAGASVNIRMIDQGSSELNIIVGIEAGDFEKAMRAIYTAFVG